MQAVSSNNTTITYFAKELSWLSFNERVLQEAKDPSNPIIERIRFLGIFSNNLDEFFQVRVADVKRRILLNNLPDTNFDEDEALLADIQKKVLELGKKFNVIYEQILADLNEHNIHVELPEALSEFHQKWLAGYFKDQVLPHLLPMMITESKDYSDNINDTMTHLFVEMRGDKNHHAFLEVPTDRLNRFVQLPPEKRDGTKPLSYSMMLFATTSPMSFEAFFSLSIFQRTP